MDIALVAVIVTGAVAVSAVLLAPLLTLWIDSIQWRRQAKSGQAEKVEAAARDLLAAIAEYHAGPDGYPNRSREQVYADLLARGYWWDLSVSPFCDKEALGRVWAVRAILSDRESVVGPKSDETVNTILAVTQAVRKKV